MMPLIAVWSLLAQPAPAPEPDAAAAEEEEEVDEYVTKDELKAVEQKLERLQAQLKGLETKQTWASRFAVHFSGYLDFGFFWVQGDGSGVRPDTHHVAAPELEGQLLGSWVLVGDPLATTINSRGDVADVGGSRAIRYDPVHAGGRPSFLDNTLNLGLQVSLGESLSVQALIDFLPRDRDIANAASVLSLFDLKLAFARYELDLGYAAHLTFEAGKIDSLLGIEYRTQESPQRLTVTPSVVCRYTCGRPMGVRALGRFFDRRFEVSLALTNGSHQIDAFPFSDQIDANRWKTVAGRVGLRLPFARAFELNVSGAIGPQDRQPDDGVLQWHAGAAGLLDIGDFTFVAEVVQGRANGKADTSGAFVLQCGVAQCLEYRAAYGLVGWKATTFLNPYVRVDFRSARHRSGDDFAYVSDTWRATLGVRADIGEHVILKMEYTFNQELGPLSFPDDVLTSSLVVRY